MTITDIFTVVEAVVFVFGLLWAGSQSKTFMQSLLFSGDLVLPIIVVEVVGRVFQWF